MDACFGSLFDCKSLQIFCFLGQNFLFPFVGLISKGLVFYLQFVRLAFFGLFADYKIWCCRSFVSLRQGRTERRMDTHLGILFVYFTKKQSEDKNTPLVSKNGHRFQILSSFAKNFVLTWICIVFSDHLDLLSLRSMVGLFLHLSKIQGVPRPKILRL